MIRSLSTRVRSESATRDPSLSTRLQSTAGQFRSSTHIRAGSKQAVIHGVLDEIREGNEAEVDIAIEQIDEESFEFPEAESDEDESTDLAWDDEGDDDELGVLTDENYTET